jgi:multimeric flavodoxin WrbA
MKAMIITCSPNKEGLTEACGRVAKDGVESAQGTVVPVRLNDLNLSKCQACGNGWGPCRNEHECQTNDDFQAVHHSLKDCDALVLVTPVYFGEMSESAKVFLDRLRRCEAFVEGRNSLEGKPVLCVAAAGGSGGGTVSCLASMEKILVRIRAESFDLVGVTQRNKSYMLDAIRSASQKMVGAEG